MNEDLQDRQGVRNRERLGWRVWEEDGERGQLLRVEQVYQVAAAGIRPCG